MFVRADAAEERLNRLPDAIFAGPGRIREVRDAPDRPGREFVFIAAARQHSGPGRSWKFCAWEWAGVGRQG